MYAEYCKGYSLLSLVRDPALKADMVFLTRRALLLFLMGICAARDVTNSRPLRRMAESSDVVRCITKFM